MESTNVDLSFNLPPAVTPLYQRSGEAPRRALHRLGLVRRQQGVALRTVARHLNVDLEEAARQEQECCDLPLSTLQRWQQVLDVPIAELLVESDDMLSGPVMDRAR